MRFVMVLLHLFAAATALPVGQPKALKPRAKPRVAVLPASAYLSTTYYLKSCPNLEGIIQQKVNAWVKRDYTMAPSVIRLHFHDCAVRTCISLLGDILVVMKPGNKIKGQKDLKSSTWGCDGSILLNHAGSERAAEASKSLRGFALIDEIKAEVEHQCPKTVSCADILTAAARDATVLAGGPFWEVPFGRKDGRISIAKEANAVPQGHENITSLLNFFDKLGLTFVDLVVLSGSHTIGRSTCASVKGRLFNFKGTGKPDPTLDSKYLNILKRHCRFDYTYVNFDATTPRTFDVAYYKNLEKKMGLLSTDQLLYSDSRTGSLVSLLATQPELFTSQFAVSMVKVGNANVLTGKSQGEIRLNCNYVNH